MPEPNNAMRSVRAVEVFYFVVVSTYLSIVMCGLVVTRKLQPGVTWMQIRKRTVDRIWPRRTHGTLPHRHRSRNNDADRIDEGIERWKRHSRSQLYLERGGEVIPPPMQANIGITDICNLQCGICGSQNMHQPVNRRHMDMYIFERVAETLFPMLTTVEINSRGEPLLHPRMPEMLTVIASHDIFLRLQTNGTQFTGRRLENLLKVTGEVSISIDATGKTFEFARTNAKWEQVDAGIRSLMDRRDPEHLGVSIYPTLTAKTIRDAPKLIRWAMKRGIERVDFHRYDPIYGGSEEIPSDDAIQHVLGFIDSLDPDHPIEVSLDGVTRKVGALPKTVCPMRKKPANSPRPIGSDGHPAFECMAPHQLVDIDLDGRVSACCYLQNQTLGNALTAEAFADCWFGEEYIALRHSMLRTSDLTPLYKTCQDCVAGRKP